LSAHVVAHTRGGAAGGSRNHDRPDTNSSASLLNTGKLSQFRSSIIGMVNEQRRHQNRESQRRFRKHLLPQSLSSDQRQGGERQRERNRRELEAAESEQEQTEHQAIAQQTDHINPAALHSMNRNSGPGADAPRANANASSNGVLGTLNDEERCELDDDFTQFLNSQDSHGRPAPLQGTETGLDHFGGTTEPTAVDDPFLQNLGENIARRPFGAPMGAGDASNQALTHRKTRSTFAHPYQTSSGPDADAPVHSAAASGGFEDDIFGLPPEEHVYMTPTSQRTRADGRRDSAKAFAPPPHNGTTTHRPIPKGHVPRARTSSHSTGRIVSLVSNIQRPLHANGPTASVSSELQQCPKSYPGRG